MLIANGQPLVYSSGKYSNDYQKTAVVVPVVSHPQGRGVYVYDLRHDPTQFINLPPPELVERWKYNPDNSADSRLPLKLLQFNRCPAIAPLGVVDEASWQRLGVDLETVQRHMKLVKASAPFADNILEAVALMDKSRESHYPPETDPDRQLYNGFVSDADKLTLRAIRAARPDEINHLGERLKDERLRALVPRYKARNYPASLDDSERQAWEAFCRQRLFDGGQQSALAQYFAKLQQLAATASEEQSYLLEELQLYGQSLMPAYDGD